MTLTYVDLYRIISKTHAVALERNEVRNYFNSLLFLAIRGRGVVRDYFGVPAISVWDVDPDLRRVVTSTIKEAISWLAGILNSFPQHLVADLLEDLVKLFLDLVDIPVIEELLQVFGSTIMGEKDFLEDRDG